MGDKRSDAQTTERSERRPGMSLAVVVLRYKKAIQEMPAFRELGPPQRLSAVKWIVVDNSPTEALAHDRSALPAGSRYLWLGGNRGLATAYNAAVALLDDSTTHVCFLDQDTRDVHDYLDAVLQQGDDGADVALPVVEAGPLILSPCRRTGPWFRPVHRRDRTPRTLSWINSGMIVATRVFASTRFDEQLFLDHVDHRFALDVQRAGASVAVRWHLELRQDYSRETDDADAAYSRYVIFRDDVRTFYGRNVPGQMWAALLTLRRALVATKKYRTTRFLAAWSSGRRVADVQAR